MRRLGVWIAVAASVGCGAVDERAACRVSADCPVGQYCAREGGESRCWPDEAPPAVSAASATCADPCLRDGVLRVTASVSDGEEVLDAAVALDLDPDRKFWMARSGDGWVVDVPLRELPFEAFSREVVATVTARDGARNESSPRSAPPVRVTRLRWGRAIDPDAVLSPTAPAVKSDGTIVVAGSNAKVYFITGEGSDAGPALTVGAGQITAAPAIGDHAIWVGSEDFSLRAVKLDGSAVMGGVAVNAEGALRGSVAVLSGGGKDWGLGAAGSGRLCGASTSSPPDSAKSTAASAYAMGPAARADGSVCAASATATALLRCHSFDGAFGELWNVGVGVNVSAPLAVDGAGAIWSGSQDGKLNRTSPAGATETVTTLDASITDSPVILAGGDVVVGDGSGVLHRVTPQGTIAWSRKLNGEATVDEPLGAPLVLAGTSATLLVPTRTGVLYALDPAGNEIWRHPLAAGVELRAPNLHTPPDQPPGQTMSHAYVSSASGWLFSVVVDGELDAAAPWPKAFHDPRNTNRAGPQP
jgi:hypothetical protein